MSLFWLTLLWGMAVVLFPVVTSSGLGEGGFQLYELLATLAPWAALTAWLWRRRDRELGLRWLWMALLGLYVALTFQVTGAGTFWEALRFGFGPLDGDVNLIPFSRGVDPVGLGLNLVLGIPLGFLLPLLWGEEDRLWRAALSGLGYSLLIEVSQLCNLRATDVDDLIANTLGAVAGWLCFRLFCRVTGWRRPAGEWPLSPAGTVAALFLGRFFLYNGFWLAKWIYG